MSETNGDFGDIFLTHQVGAWAPDRLTNMSDIFTLHSQRKPEVGFPYIAGLGMQLAFVSQL